MVDIDPEEFMTNTVTRGHLKKSQQLQTIMDACSYSFYPIPLPLNYITIYQASLSSQNLEFYEQI